MRPQLEHVLQIILRFRCCLTAYRSAEVASKHRHRFQKTLLRCGVDCCGSTMGLHHLSLERFQSTHSAAQAPCANCCLLSDAFFADSARHSECNSNWNIYLTDQVISRCCFTAAVLRCAMGLTHALLQQFQSDAHSDVKA